MDCFRHIRPILSQISEPNASHNAQSKFEYFSDQDLYDHLIERTEFDENFKIRGFSAIQIQSFNQLVDVGLVVAPSSNLIERVTTQSLLRKEGMDALSLFQEKRSSQLKKFAAFYQYTLEQSQNLRAQNKFLEFLFYPFSSKTIATKLSEINLYYKILNFLSIQMGQSERTKTHFMLVKYYIQSGFSLQRMASLLISKAKHIMREFNYDASMKQEAQIIENNREKQIKSVVQINYFYLLSLINFLNSESGGEIDIASMLDDPKLLNYRMIIYLETQIATILRPLLFSQLKEIELRYLDI